MANTYSQMYAQIIFCPKGRQNLILPVFEERLYQYITGIVRSSGPKLIAINGMKDHIHIFLGFKPHFKISDLVRDVKTASAKLINENRWLPGKFAWQEGYGCFTYAHSQLDVVAKYVMNQKEHHKTKTFREEYVQLLELFHVEYDEKYLFEFYE
ncbi:MAG: IS200/IS605 family transposase [Saprospiraceae bacterium]|nr:IS200/IS605 family transposase [Saprospiraceae bacterium]